MRGGRSSSLAFALTIAVIVSTTLSAHRRDEYLQAARLAIDPDRVQIELDLTPGIAVADAVLADIDCDANGSISAVEARAYSERVASATENPRTARKIESPNVFMAGLKRRVSGVRGQGSGVRISQPEFLTPDS